MNRKAVAIILVTLAACARSEDAVLLPIDNNQAAKVETVRPDRDEQEIAIGAWRESLQDDQPALEFGPAGAPALFSLRCDARRGVLLQRHGPAPTGELPVMRVSVGSASRQLAVTSTSGATPMLRAALAPSDPLLATLASATGPIAIRVGDSASLNLPPDPAIGSYIGRCANGEAPAAADAGASTNAAANQSAPQGN